MKTLTDKQIIVRMLKRQIKRQAGDADWEPIKFTENTGEVNMLQDNDSVTFAFDAKGKLLGVYGW